MRFEFYKQLYDSEWTRREQIAGAIGTPMALLVLLGGGILTLIGGSRSIAGKAQTLFLLAVAGAVISFAVGVYYLAKAYFGHKYRRIPWPSEMITFDLSLLAYHKQELIETAVTDEKFQEAVIARLVDAADTNAKINLRRSEWLHRANAGVLITLVFAGVAAVPFVLARLNQPDMVQKVELVKHAEGSVTASDTSDEKPAQPTENAKKLLTEPVLPPNKDVRTEIKKE